MMAVSRLVIRPLRLYQQPRLPKNAEQAIPADLHLRLRQARAQHAVQFARTNARLAQPDRLDQLYNRFTLMRLISFPLATFVIRLAADTHETASPLYVQSFDLTTTDSLPEDFFTVTPCSSRMMLITVSNSADFCFSSLSCCSNSLIRCSGVKGLLGLFGIVALRLLRPLGWVQSCKPCLRHHTKTVDRP